MRCDKRFEDDHPAGVGGPLKKRVSQLRNVDIHFIGTVDEIYNRDKTMYLLQTLKEITQKLFDPYNVQNNAFKNQDNVACAVLHNKAQVLHNTLITVVCRGNSKVTEMKFKH